MVLSLCCINKTMNGWNLERTASICRERCGGQGYLSVNKFGDYLAIAHAALTAEGDNRVLMVKICKDMMTNVLKKGHKLPQMSQCPFREIAKADDITSLTTLLDMLKYRETIMFNKLVQDTKDLQTKKVSSYNILMRETSDTMQDLAMVYGERQTLEYCIERLAGMKSAANKEVMTKVFRLFGLEVIKRDMSFYMMQGLISQNAVASFNTARITIIKDIAAKTDDLLDCLNIPKHALYAPIA